MLTQGDCIGIVCPSHIANPERHRQSIQTLERLGFRVKLGENVYKNTYGYLASEQERAADFNDMVADESVKLVLFGGGEGSCEILPLIDYAAVRQNPKHYCSFSDGTSILLALHAMSGLRVHYGQGPGMFTDLRQYDYAQFQARFVQNTGAVFVKDSDWKTLHPGACTGRLIGGYTRNFALMLGSRYFSYDKNAQYLLFLEDHEKFSNVAEVSSFLSYIEQHDFMRTVCGLIFGHYAENAPQDLLLLLERFGQKHGVPVVYTDDFGHGTRHAIFPIGQNAALDARNQTLTFLET